MADLTPHIPTNVPGSVFITSLTDSSTVSPTAISALSSDNSVHPASTQLAAVFTGSLPPIPTQSPDIQRPTHKPTNVGLIAGTTIGACVLVFVIIVTLIFFIRKRKRYHEVPMDAPNSFNITYRGGEAPMLEPHSIEPFTLNTTVLPVSRRDFGEKSLRGDPSPRGAWFHEGPPLTGTGETPSGRSQSLDPPGDLHAPEVAETQTQQNIAGATNVGSTIKTDDPDTIPDLIQRLIQAIAKLPPGGMGPGEAEEPPEYFAEY